MGCGCGNNKKEKPTSKVQQVKDKIRKVWETTQKEIKPVNVRKLR